MNFRNFMKGPIEEVFKIGDEEHKLTGYSRANIEAQKEKIRQAKKQDDLNRRLSKIGGKTVELGRLSSLKSKDKLNLSYINSLPQPCLRLCEVKHICEVNYFLDANGNKHDSDSFYTDYTSDTIKVENKTPEQWLKENHATLKDIWRYAYLNLNGEILLSKSPLGWRDNKGWMDLFEGKTDYKEVRTIIFPKPKPNDVVSWNIDQKHIFERSFLRDGGCVYELPF